VHILAAVGFEWDATKAAANLRKHGVDFADAVAVFEDLRAVTIEDKGGLERRFSDSWSRYSGTRARRLLHVAGRSHSLDLRAQSDGART
jgi:uncharacterized DUF497 family protein